MTRIFFFTLCALLFAFPARAQDIDLSAFSRIPVQHEGRIKPMDSFARANLKTLSGNESGAAEWLAEVLFDPAGAENARIVKISNPDLLDMLGLPARKDKLFAYNETLRALADKNAVYEGARATPPEKLTHAQKDLINLVDHVSLLGDLLSSLTLYLPLSVAPDETAPAPFKQYAGKTLTFDDAREFRDALDKKVAATARRKGENIDSYTSSERSLAALSFALNEIANRARLSQTFRVIPAGETWLAPWQADKDPALKDWKTLARAYNDDDAKTFSETSEKIRAETLRAAQRQIRGSALELERFYNAAQPFYIAACLYALALLGLVLSALLEKPVLARAAAFSLIAGAFIHALGLAARVYILARPPVSTLYESILFVSLIAVLYALSLYARERKNGWIALAAGIGLVLQILGFSHDSDGDTLLMLTAVLNTNFWLATHVICITAGYAFCIVASLLAHRALIATVIDKKISVEEKLFRPVHTAALIALMFAATGTALGGIWADQSWGRFWGWDPKENGALLIVLWLIWAIHGRVSAMMNTTWVCAALAFLSVIVALSWFGVNLLGVGLHSYGFTDDAAYGLAAFALAEIALIGALVHRIRHAR